MFSIFTATAEKNFKRIAAALILFTAASSLSCAQTVTGANINAGYGDLHSGIRLTYSTGDLFYGEITNQGLVLTGMLYVDQEKVPTALPPEDISNFSFYPNPCRSVLHIKSDLNGPLIIRFYNLNGILVRNEWLMENNAIDLSALADGIYLIQVSDKDLNFHIVEKLIKTN